MSKRHIEVIARGVMVADGRLLVCHTKGADNTYLPGGHVEFEESAEDALVREIREEMGLSAKVIRFLGACEHAFVQKGRPHSEVNLVFEMQVEGISPVAMPASEEDYIEFFWEDVEELDCSGLEPASLRTVLGKWLASSDSAGGWASSIPPESH